MNAAVGMAESCEVEEKVEVDPKTVRAIGFGAKHKASLESAPLDSQNCWGVTKARSGDGTQRAEPHVP